MLLMDPSFGRQRNTNWEEKTGEILFPRPVAGYKMHNEYGGCVREEIEMTVTDIIIENIKKLARGNSVWMCNPEGALWRELMSGRYNKTKYRTTDQFSSLLIEQTKRFIRVIIIIIIIITVPSVGLWWRRFLIVLTYSLA